MENLEIAKIRRDGGTQPRAALDEATIAEYAEAIQAGAEMPAVDVFFDGERYWLADGYHRVTAHERAGKHFVLATLHQGDRRAAVLFSTGVNADHGLRRNNADKRRAVEVLLRDQEWSKWSDREIARQAKVGHVLVSEMRKSICSQRTDSTPSAIESQIDPSASSTTTERTVVRAGTTYTMSTGNIGSQPATGFATPEQLAPTVRSWLGSFAPGSRAAQRNVLRQIGLQNPVGMDQIAKLAEYCRRAGQRGLMGDLKRACAGVLAELEVTEVAGGRTGELPGNSGERRELGGDEGTAGTAGDSGAPGAVETVEPVEPETGEPGPGPAAVKGREPHLGEVYDWLKVNPADALTRGAVAHAAQMLAECLDLEGFAARRGRNFQWESLIGAVGADVDHDALRAVVKEGWAQLVARRDGMPEEGNEGNEGNKGNGGNLGADEIVTAVQAWLSELVENNELADDEDGKRTALRAIIHGRNNGGAQLWRSLRQYARGRWSPVELVAAARRIIGEPGDAEAQTSTGRTTGVSGRPASWSGVRPNGSGQAPVYVRGVARGGNGQPAETPATGLDLRGKVQLAAAQVATVQAALVEYAGGLEHGDGRLAGIIELVAGVLDLLTTEA